MLWVSLGIQLPALLALAVMLLPLTTQVSVSQDSWRPLGASGLVIELSPLFPEGFPAEFPAGDSMAAPHASTLRVAVNGVAAGPGHAEHATIAERGNGAFSHWLDALYFSAPVDIGTRDAARMVTLSWPVLPASPGRLQLAAAVASLGLGLALWDLLRRVRWRRPPGTGPGIGPAPRPRVASPEYRPDIDGLRAVALLLILEVHLGGGWLPGAFLGVDIFFVISGYLISDILLRQLQSGGIDLVEFYRRRLYRLMPAALVVGAGALALGYRISMPTDYQRLAESLGAALLGIANLYFIQHTGYFDAPAQTMPMLHHWSLSVEVQFYLSYPLLLWIGCRLPGGRKTGPALVMSVAFALSLAAAIHGAATQPAAAFFMPQNRAWEFLAGSLACLVPRGASRLASASSALGVLLLALGVLTFDSAHPHPNWPALMPVLGVALIVHGGAPGSRIGALLAWRPLVAIGLASYSIYLWHWPLIALWYQYTNRIALLPAEVAGLLCLAFLLGFATWRWVELPWRGRRPRLAAARVAGLVVPALMALGIATISTSGGLPDRIPESMRRWADSDAAWAWACPSTAQLGLPSLPEPERPAPSCIVGVPWETARHRAILWGDSTAEHLLPLLHLLAQQEGMSVALVAMCPAVIQPGQLERRHPAWPDYTRRCGLVRAAVLDRLRRRPGEVQLLLLAAAWQSLSKLPSPSAGRQGGIARLEASFAGLLPSLAGISRVVLINPPPTLPLLDPISCFVAGQALWRRGCGTVLEHRVREQLDFTAPVRALLRHVAGQWPNLRVYDPADRLCDDRSCMISLDGLPLYMDAVHYRRDLPPETLARLAVLLGLNDLLAPVEAVSQAATIGESTIR